MSNHLLDAAHQLLLSAPVPPAPTDIANPFDGILPSFSFGAAFDVLWKRLFAAFWGIIIIITGVFGLYHFAGLAKGGESSNPHEVQQSKRRLMWAGVALVGELAFIPIIGIIFFLV